MMAEVDIFRPTCTVGRIPHTKKLRTNSTKFKLLPPTRASRAPPKKIKTHFSDTTRQSPRNEAKKGRVSTSCDCIQRIVYFFVLCRNFYNNNNKKSSHEVFKKSNLACPLLSANFGTSYTNSATCHCKPQQGFNSKD